MKQKNFLKISLFALMTVFSFNMNGQIISQYIETNSGTTPKGIEVWNNTASTLDFSANNLVVEKGTNGASPSADVTITTGTLAPNTVMVIGTSGMGTYLTDEGLTSVIYVDKSFTFNGDDALVVKYGGTITDMFGVAGVDPGSHWNGGGVSTKNQNIRLIDETDTAGGGLNTGDTDGWTDPSTRFVTVSTTPSTVPGGLAGFGIAPITTVWDGSDSSNWATIANWSNGIPIVSSNVSIADVATAPIIGATTGAVSNDLTIAEPDGINITAGGSLIVSGTSSGNVTYNRTVDFVSGDLKGWYLMSSPVVGQDYNDAYVTANDIAEGSGANRGIATYTTASDSWVYHQGAASATFTAGKGYSVKRQTNTGTVSFTGTLNTSDSGVDFVLANAGNRINLLGNPYTSSISSATLLGNAALSETQTMWIYDQTSGTNGAYGVKTLGNNFILAPGQGFFVLANAAGGTVNFAEANQSHNADTFQKTANTEIKVQISLDGFQNYAKVYYLDNATTGFDVGYEGEVFGGSTDSFSIYTQLLTDNIEKKYQVQSLPNSDYENMVIPIGVNAAAGKEITFSADALDLPADIKVFLEDRLTNTFTRLDETNSEYKVTLSETLNGVGRFYMHTTESVMSTEDVILNSVRIYKTDSSTLKITGLPQGKTSFYLYNILGKEMMSTLFTSNGNKEISLSKLASGIYLAKMQTEKGAISKKIILE